MVLNRARQLCALNRSLFLVIPLSILLLASFGWNVWRYQLDQDQRAQAKHAERTKKAAAALANEEAERAQLRRKARYAQSDARIQQLYNEINHLTEVSEKTLLPNPAIGNAPDRSASQDKTAGAP
jgi:hypothetical protein